MAMFKNFSEFVNPHYGWVLVSPKELDFEDATNEHVDYHIFKITWTESDKSDAKFVSNDSICSSINRKHRATINLYYFLGDNRDDARINIAKFQNGGTEICGNCVRKFYCTE